MRLLIFFILLSQSSFSFLPLEIRGDVKEYTLKKGIYTIRTDSKLFKIEKAKLDRTAIKAIETLGGRASIRVPVTGVVLAKVIKETRMLVR